MDLSSAGLDLFAAAMIGVLLIGTAFQRDHPKPFGKKIRRHGHPFHKGAGGLL